MKNDEKLPGKRQHHHMVSATILFSIPVSDTESAMNTVPLNAIVFSDKDQVTLSMIGKAQQAAQMQLIKKLDAEDAANVVIHDVVITSITNLGYMTQEEFNDVKPSKGSTASLELVK